MIYKNNKLVLEVQKEILEKIEEEELKVLKNIGAIYKGTLLVWLTIYNAVRSCFGSGLWILDKPWFGDDLWKNN